MSQNDASLVRRCMRGETAALQTLVDQFQGLVFGICFRMLHHRQDAEDLTHEVFVRVLRSLKRWDSGRPLRPWILAIAVNRCKTWLQNRAKRPELVEYLQEVVPTNEVGVLAELTREIHDAVAELPDNHRVAFLKFHEQALPYDEIAQILEKPVGTIKTWLHRARLKMMERLKQRGMMPEFDHELP